MRAPRRPWRGRRARAIERIDQVVERNVGIDVVPDAHLAVDGQDGAARIELALREREIGVGQDDAEQQQRVRILDQAR